MPGPFEIASGISLLALAIGLWGYSKASDYRLGRQARRDGLALNAGWSPAMKRGWADQFHEGLSEEIAASRRQG